MKKWVEKDKEFILPTYGKREIAFSRGEGVWLYDVERKKYLDLLSGIGVNILGHSHPRVVKAIKEQSEKLIHTSNLYLIPNQIKLAEKLISLTFQGKCFFCNSGTEAVEGAIKIAKKWGRIKNKTKIISTNNSFHGRTCGSLSITGQKKYQKNFLPLLPNIKFIPFNDINSLKKEFDNKTSAIIIEPIQGEGGINVADFDFLLEARKISEERNSLLIFDEIQCGMGRTGKLFAFQKFGIQPDILCIGKGIAGGIPMGAVVVSKKFENIFEVGDHASTFGGNPFATHVSFEVLNTLIEENLIEKSEEKGNYIKEKLNSIKKHFSFIKKIKGLGLMIGIEIDGDVKKIKSICERNGILVGTAGENVIRFLPPLIINKEEIDYGLNIFEKSLKEYEK